MRTLFTISICLMLISNAFADTEPANNSYVTADILAPNGSATGTVTYSSDPGDFYRIVTATDGNLQFTLTGSTTDFIYLDVYDSDGTTVLASTTNNGTTGVTVTIYGRSAGTYYVRVGQLTSGTNVYSLSNVFTAETIANDAEPNDVVGTALNLATNSLVHGHIGFQYNGGAFDVDDYYKVVTAADGNLKFSVLGTEANYMYVYLYDSNGTTQLDANTALGTNGIALTVNGLAAGTYYFRIAAHTAPHYNGYTLTDTLTLEQPINDIEPNDTVTTASTFSPNTSISGHIGYRFNGGAIDTYDYWKIISPWIGDINIDFTGTQTSYLYLTLYDSTGTNQVGGSSGIGNTNLNFTATAQPAGTYYLRIAAFNGPSYNGYTITNSVPTAVDPGTENSNRVRLFPNPANGSCMVFLENPTATEGTIVITDLSGKQCSTEDFSLEGRNFLPLNLEGLSNGIYFVRVNLDDRVVIKKLIVGE